MSAAIASLNEKFAADNACYAEPAQSLFAALCGDADACWKFLNTLSYMEHIGSYKIMATQWGDGIDYQTLRHLQEEAGHAVLFKRHAERLSGTRIDYGDANLMAPSSARMYFARLEALLSQMFANRANRRTIYLYMSLIVEFRAVWAYGLLQRPLDDAGLEVSLAKLLAEEQGHLYSMARRLDADGHFSADAVETLCRREQQLFRRLLNALEHYRPGARRAA